MGTMRCRFNSMQLTLNLKDTENTKGLTTEDKIRLEEIFNALIATGGLTGVKAGKTIIHFGGDGSFQKIQLDYYPWQKRHQD